MLKTDVNHPMIFFIFVAFFLAAMWSCGYSGWSFVFLWVETKADSAVLWWSSSIGDGTFSVDGTFPHIQEDWCVAFANS